MKQKHIIIFLFFLPLLSVAQPNRGWKAGMNVNWINFENSVCKYSPGIGYHVGYAWRINCSPKVSISIESLINRKSVNFKHDQFFYVSDEEKGDFTYDWEQERLDAYGLSAPVGINYLITPWLYASGGYEFSWFPEDFGNDYFDINIYDHAFYLGSGFHTRYFDFVIRYSKSLNKSEAFTANYFDENGVLTDSYTQKNHKINNLQFSIILSLGKKNKKE
ncbi:hypothetical protein DMA11_20180 [Marinilabiliaceae bacterium JC017]|nr:hypothetical protein DMA11_20180 [Marinilabiliaceae bacterium JC017]